ncbi:TMV resistance protein N-like [Neltuma alba]|uniref:TMV resistance protein N-like n=1 Tax=Neltuma alba TaxID=207710 RepID=UPI0010A34E3D|nr:TMV resistance protein N-like [Prosopis alba]
MAAFASASSSQVSSRKYEVFISFRGTDVRSSFLCHLKNELLRKKIDVYVDDRLERGEEISLALVEAIEGSMIALVIFSKNYASSKWCLEELVKIIECKEAGQQIVIPIFYHVDPSDVRHQRGTYEEAFTCHEQKLKDKVQNLQIWRSVLKKTANLAGFHSSNFQDESKLINAIVEDVLKNLEDHSPTVSRSQLIGFHQNLTSVESLMENESPEVRALGIWGLGGIGKTTLARAIFEKFLSKFEEKKVLIVLDDVDNPKQLKDLAGQQLYLGQGSRVIATSRDKHVLRSGGIQEKYIHEVSELSLEESLELFSIHAFNQNYPIKGYEELSNSTVALARGIPLALEVLGSHFHSRDEAYWKSELSKLQKYPHQDIQNILKVSYDGLDNMDKQILLDIAFFFVGEQKGEVIPPLEACGFRAVSGIQNLIDKALVKLGELDHIIMHDLIREMAEQIVREECVNHPELRSRLNDADEICDVLKDNKSLPLDFCPENLVELRMNGSNVTKLWDGVKDLVNLRTINLRLCHKLMELPDFSMAYKLENIDLSDCSSLRSVHPSILSLHTLVKLDVDYCHELESLESETHLESLSDLQASGCGLKKFCLSSNKLESIYLRETRLEILDLPIGRFTKLRSLLILHGERLRSLPIKELCCLTNLKEFQVRDFKQEIHTEELRSLFNAWHNLEKLCLDGWSYLSEIPDDIKYLTRLHYLSLEHSGVETLPPCVSHLSSLTSIYLFGCERLKSILGLPPMLKALDANDCTLLETVSSDSLVCNPCWFQFKNCVKLDECSLGSIEELTHFSLTSACKDDIRGATACYPGNRVPKWMKYKQMTEASNTIQFTCNLERAIGILFCCVAPHRHLRSPGQDPLVTCYITCDDIVTESLPCNKPLYELDSDHVFIWPRKGFPFGTGTGDDVKISCEFFLEWRDHGKMYRNHKVPIEACGVHVIYDSESEPGSGQKRKRVADIVVEDGVPPTKRLNNSWISQPTPLGLALQLGLATTKSNKSHDNFICHPLQLKFMRKKKQEDPLQLKLNINSDCSRDDDISSRAEFGASYLKLAGGLFADQ